MGVDGPPQTKPSRSPRAKGVRVVIEPRSRLAGARKGLSDRNDGGWLAGVVPDAVALKALSVDVHGPETVTLGEPARFFVVVRNRFPVTLRFTLPSSRLWGWHVDDAPEADERGYEPPDAPRTVIFGRNERRVFEATWDGRIRRAERSGDRWIPHEGTAAFTGYLAADGWERRGLYDELTVEVVSDR